MKKKLPAKKAKIQQRRKSLRKGPHLTHTLEELMDTLNLSEEDRIRFKARCQRAQEASKFVSTKSSVSTGDGFHLYRDYGGLDLHLEMTVAGMRSIYRFSELDSSRLILEILKWAENHVDALVEYRSIYKEWGG